MRYILSDLSEAMSDPGNGIWQAVRRDPVRDVMNIVGPPCFGCASEIAKAGLEDRAPLRKLACVSEPMEQAGAVVAEMIEKVEAASCRAWRGPRRQ